MSAECGWPTSVCLGILIFFSKIQTWLWIKFELHYVLDFQWQQLSLDFNSHFAVAVLPMFLCRRWWGKTACSHHITPAAPFMLSCSHENYVYSHAVTCSRSMHLNIEINPTTLWLKSPSLNWLAKVEPVLSVHITWHHRGNGQWQWPVRCLQLPSHTHAYARSGVVVAGEGRRIGFGQEWTYRSCTSQLLMLLHNNTTSLTKWFTWCRL